MPSDIIIVNKGACIGIQSSHIVEDHDCKLYIQASEIMHINKVSSNKQCRLNYYSSRVICKKSIKALCPAVNINKCVIINMNNGMPVLTHQMDNLNISLSHTDYYSVSYISHNTDIGIDIEMINTKNLKTLQYFFNRQKPLLKEMTDYSNELILLTACWSACEAMYKVNSRTNRDLNLESIVIDKINPSKHGWTISFKDYEHLIAYSRVFDRHVISIAQEKSVENHLRYIDAG
jgi:phosphopantetheinyl transferase